MLTYNCAFFSTGEEWQKREEQRQQLLRQKLEHYSSLEKELQEALAQVQAQQKQLSERETKVRIVLWREREREKEEWIEISFNCIFSSFVRRTSWFKRGSCFRKRWRELSFRSGHSMNTSWRLKGQLRQSL